MSVVITENQRALSKALATAIGKTLAYAPKEQTQMFLNLIAEDIQHISNEIPESGNPKEIASAYFAVVDITLVEIPETKGKKKFIRFWNFVKGLKGLFGL